MKAHLSYHRRCSKSPAIRDLGGGLPSCNSSLSALLVAPSCLPDKLSDWAGIQSITPNSTQLRSPPGNLILLPTTISLGRPSQTTQTILEALLWSSQTLRKKSGNERAVSLEMYGNLISQAAQLSAQGQILSILNLMLVLLPLQGCMPPKSGELPEGSAPGGEFAVPAMSATLFTGL